MFVKIALSIVLFIVCPLTVACAIAQPTGNAMGSYRYGGIPEGHSLAEFPPETYIDPQPGVYSQQAPIAQTQALYLEEPLMGGLDPIRLQHDTLFPLLDFQNRQGDKQLTILESQLQNPESPALLLGAQFRVSGLAARTNRRNKFSYLGRFPPDFTGSSATDLRMLQANQGAVAHFTPWASGYVETLFSDVFSFPTFNQGSFQVRQAYILLGDLNVSPVYGFFGKKNVSFGDMGTLSPFTQSVVWHYFAPIHEGAGIGYSQNGFDATFTALSGSRGIRVADSSDRGTVNNFATNLSYSFLLTPDTIVTLGSGYLHGTIYDQALPEHTNPTLIGPRNPAWDVNGKVQFGPTTFAAEYVQTASPWPATNHEVQAWKAESAFDAAYMGLPVVASVSWSEGIQGDNGTEFEFNKQLVLGLRYNMSPNVFCTFEYVRSLGFAPLIDIATVSDRNVRQNSFVFGMVLAI